MRNLKQSILKKMAVSLFCLLAMATSFNLKAQSLSTPPSKAISNVSEASGYGVVYQLNIPNSASYSTQSAISYAVNNSGISGISFKRVAYFLDLGTTWVWASMDKFNSSVALTDLGIPPGNSSTYFQQIVTNLHVVGSSGSNVTNITANGTNGNVEIWPQCYSQGASLAGIGGSSSTYDFNDTRSSGGGCYGSFQVHNYGASQTIFAYNDWTGGGGDLGIGNNTNSSNGNPDWTFMANTSSYTTKTLYILVDDGVSAPTPASQALCISATPTALSVTASPASGTTISSYNWYSNTTNSSTGGTLVATHTSTSSTDSYTPSTSAAGTTYYYATMTNSAGTVVTGGTASVSVNATTAITGQPSTSAQSVNYNASATALTVTASGAGTLTYQWYSNTTASNSGGTSISGATSATYTPLTTALGTLYYYAVATSTCGSATSNVSGGVTINLATPTITTAPTASSISYGQTLASSTLSGGAASVAGTFVFTTPTTAPAAGTSSQGYTFTPTNITDYNTVTGTVSVTVNAVAPTISNFTVATQVIGASPITLTAPTSNSAGLFSYTSSNTSVATVSGNTLTIVGVGTSTITATQAANGNYTSGNITATLTVNNEALDKLGLTSTYASPASFSLRLLSSNYTGYAVQVRRSSDNTTQNIGFTTNGDLDTASLKTFVGSGNGFVTIWYDQSGNGRNATQSTTSLQPQIVNGGVIYRQYGEPTLFFNASYLQTTSFTGYSSAFSLAICAGVATDGGYQSFGGRVANPYYPVPWDFYNSGVLIGNGGSGSYIGYGLSTGLTAATGFAQWVFTGNASTSVAYENGTTDGSGTVNAYGDANIPLVIGGRNDHGTQLNGWVSEYVTLNSVLSATDRGTVQSNQTNYFLTKVAPTIGTFTVPSQTYGASSFTLTAPTSNSSGTFSYSSSNTSVASISGNTVTIVGVGTSTITANQAANGAYTSGSTTATLTVSKATPSITTAPTASAITIGQTLASSTLSGGVGSVAGTFAFTAPSIAPSVGTASQGYTFTPTNTTDYNTVTGTVSVTVIKATPSITTAPTANSIVYGQTLASSTLSGGTASVAGTFAFTTPTTAPSVGTASQGYTFTPTDAADYNSITGIVSVTVNKATPTITTTPKASMIYYGQTLASSTLSGGVASVAGTFAFTTPGTTPTSVGTSSQGYTFTPSDATDYNTVTGTVNVVVCKATPTVTVIPATYTYNGSAQGPASATNTGTGSSYTFSYAGTAADGTTYSASATAPTKAGNYTVTATVAVNGNYASASSVPTSFTIGKAILTITAANQSVCFGTSVSVVTGAGSYSVAGYQGSDNASVISGSATYTTTYTSTTAGGTSGVTITPVVTGLSASNYSITASAGIVTVNALPIATITNGGATTFCSGGSVTLTSSVGSGYSWSNGATTPSITVTTAGFYSVTVTNANGCTATSAATTVTVNALPTPTVTASGATTFCSGGSVTLNTGGASYTGDALTFSGSNYVDVPTNSALSVGTSTDFTYEAWAKLNGNQPNYAGIVIKGSGAPFTQLVIVNNNVAAEIYSSTGFIGTGSGLEGNTNLNDGKWHHLAMTVSRSTNTCTLYVDGNVQATVTNSAISGNVDNSNDLLIGVERTRSLYFNGSIDEVRVWNTARTQSQIQANMNSTVPTNSTGLVAYYKFDEGSGSTAYDATSNGHNGTLINSPTWLVPSTSPISSFVSYAWSNGATTSSISPTTTGNYSVTVTDNHGCTNTSASTSVTVNALPTATITPSGATTFCAGGSVTLTASAGTSYSWSNGATTPSITVTTTGSYTVTVTNASGCSATSAATSVTVNPTNTITLTSASATTSQITYINSAITNITYNTTSATGATFSGLPTGVTGSWSSNVVTISGTPTVAGVYNYTVTLSGGCGTVTATGSITVPSVSITSSASTICAGGSVTFTATPSYATSPTYQWTKNGTAISGATSSTYTTTGLANNDVIAVNMTVAGAGGGSGSSISGMIQYLDANKTASYGGTGSTWYDLSGNNNNGTLNSASFATTSGFSYFNLSNTYISAPVAKNASMTYNVWAKTSDPTNCMLFNAGNQGSGPDLFFYNNAFSWNVWDSYGSPFNVSTSIVDQNWHNYTVVVDASTNNAKLYFDGSLKGTATYHISSSNNLYIGGAGPNDSWYWKGAVSSFQTYNRALSATEVLANYNSLSGASGSLTSNSITTTVNPLPTVTITPSGATTFCAGGSVTLTATAGTSYAWSTGATTQAITTSTSGTYSVAVTNANGCSATSSSTTVTVNPLPVATITASGATTFCSGGSVTLTASAGSSYAWSTGAITQSITVNTTGSYTVTVTNASGCSTVSAATAVTVNPLPAVTITAGGPTTFCAGGSVTLTASAGTSYAWSDGETTQAITTSTAGTYSVTVTNSYGCSAVSSTNFGNALSFNGSTSSGYVSISGGTPTSVQGTNNVFVGMWVYPTSSSGGLFNLGNGGTCGGSIRLILSGGSLTIDHGCGVQTSSVSIPTSQWSYVFVSYNSSTGYTVGKVSGGTVTKTSLGLTGANHGSGPLYFGANTVNGNYLTGQLDEVSLWNTNLTDAQIINYSSSGITGSPSGLLGYWKFDETSGTTTADNSGNGLSGTLVNSPSRVASTITGGGGTTVTVNPLPTPTITASGATTFCSGNSITLTASAGSSYAWSTGATTQSITVTTSGSYTVTVTNSNGCSATSSATVVTVNPSPTVASITGTAGVCVNSTTTLADATTSGVWASASTGVATITSGGVVTGVSAGTSVISYAVTNSYSCTTTVNQTVTVYALPVVAGSSQPGAFGNGLNFNGSNYVTMPRSSTLGILNHSFTVEAWVNVSNFSSGDQGILADPTSCDLHLIIRGQHPYLGFCGNDIAASTTMTAGTWYHIAWEYNSATSTQSIFVNGVLDNSGSGHGALSTDAVLAIGKCPWGTLTGTVDEMRIWNYALSQSQIQATMNTQLAGNESGLVAYYDFNEGTAGGNNSGVTTLYDRTSNGYNGTLNSFTLSGSTSNWVAGASSTGGTTTPGNVCVNSTLQLTNSTSGGSWTSSNTAVATVSSTGLVSGVSAGTATISYTVTNSNGCSTTVTTNITVNPLPTASIAGTVTVKKGATSPNVTFTGANGTAPYTFTYTINGGSSQTVTSSGNTATVAAPTNVGGAFVYALVSVKDASASTCTNAASGSITVTVNPLQGVISGTTTVCQNASSPSITIVGSNGTAPYTFTYNINGGSTLSVTSTGSTATISVPTGTAGTYAYNLLSVQDANALFAATSATGTATVTVNPQPTPSITGGTYGCGNISYTANGGVSYLWNTGATPTTSANTFTTATSYTATVVATGSNGCTASASQVIPANTAPTITSVAAQNTLVETAVAPTVTVGDLETPNNLTVTGTSSNTKLVPNANIVVTGSGATRTITVTPAQDQIGTATITVTVADCGGLSTSTTFNVTVTVPNYPSGTAAFAIRKTVSLIDNCSDSIYFVNRSYNGAGASYQWYINGYYTTQPSFLNSPSGLIGYKNSFPGTYTALLVITDPVHDTTYTVSQTFTFTRGIIPVPSPAFMVHSVNPNGAGTATVTLNSLTPSVQDGLINAWTITPMTNIAAFDATATTPTLSITQTTSAQTFNATLTVTPTNGCKSYTTAAQTITVPAYSPIVANFTVGVTKSKVDACNDSVYIINTTTGGVGGNTYTWYLGDNSPAIVTTSTNPIGKIYTHPNTYSILLNVTDATGQTASKQLNVTTNGTIPAVTAVAEVYGPNNTTNTATVTIEGGNSTIAYGSLNYAWTVTPTGGTATTYNNVNQQLTFNRTSASQTYTAQLTVKDALTGCRTNTATQTFTIDQLQAIPPTATPIAANFTVGVTKSKIDPCSDSVYIVNTTTGGTGGNTYTWYFGDNSSSYVTTSTATIGKKYVYPNTYTIVMDVADHAGQYTTKQLTVTTNGTVPAVTANPIVYGPNNSTATSSVLLEGGNSSTAYGTLNYLWTVTPAGGTPTTYTTVNVPLTITRTSAAQSYTSILTVSDATGCRTNSATSTFTIPALAPVAPAPTPISANFTINVTKSKVDPCADSIYFTNTTTGGAGGLVYTWYLGDNTSSPYVTTSTATFGHIYTYPNTYSVLLVVNDNAGQYSSKQLNVTTVGTIPAVNAVPIIYGPAYTTNAATVTLDGGNSYTAYGSLTYLWTLTPTGGSATTYTTANPALTINRTSADQAYTAVLTVKDALTGCKSSTGTQTFTITKLAATPVVPATLTANFTVNVTKSKVDPCSDSVYVTNTTTGGAGNNNYVWYFGDGSNVSTTSTNPIGKIYTYPNTYNIQLDVTDKSGTTSNKIIAVTTVGTIPTVNAVPILYGPYNGTTSSTITLDGGNSTISYGSGLIYQWVVTVGGVSTTYNTANPALTINRTSADQVYTAVLTVTDATGCRKSVGATQTFTIPKLVAGAETVTMAELSAETKNGISVYPNPIRDNVNVKVSLTDASAKVIIRVYTSMGKQVVVNNQTTGNTKEVTTNISFKNLAAGLYYIKVFNEAGALVGSSTVVKQ